jgi:hypothetical protein
VISSLFLKFYDAFDSNLHRVAGRHAMTNESLPGSRRAGLEVDSGERLSEQSPGEAILRLCLILQRLSRQISGGLGC